MKLTPRTRKLALTVHLTVTIGWLGAVIVFMAMAVIGLTSPDEAVVRGTYLVMEPAAWLVLVPLAIASVASGFIVSLGSNWGLVRHYWIVVKLALTLAATLILIAYMGTFGAMAEVAADPDAPLGSVRNPSPAIHAALALVVLIVTTVLGVYKPPGMTRYGLRRRLGTASDVDAGNEVKGRGPAWMRALAYGAMTVLILATLLFVGRVTGHGMAPH